MPEFGSEHSTPPRAIAAETGVTGRHARDSDCAGGGNRTRTALRPRDFKSRASASSATPARDLFYAVSPPLPGPLPPHDPVRSGAVG